VKTREEVSSEKLRGGFYTPPGLIADVMDAARLVLRGQTPTMILEPSVGDGAFIPAIAAHFPDATFVGVEIDERESAKASTLLGASGLRGEIVNDSTLNWALRAPAIDLIVGNLPFVRFQFLSERDRELAALHARINDVDMGGVANLWWPMLLASLSKLSVGGVFSLILPSEFFTGVTAGSAREWLLRQTAQLRIDVYPPKSYPNVLQEIVILSGMKVSPSDSAPNAKVTIADRGTQRDVSISAGTGEARTLPVGPENWIALFLSRSEASAYGYAMELPSVGNLREFAKFEVAAVTGANAFFSLTEADVRTKQLQNWVVPLLSRMRYAPGLVYTADDHAKSVGAGAATQLFAVQSMLDDERSHEIGLNEYLTSGESAGLHTRFKTRTRRPWYAIPSVRSEELLLSKRSHAFPRVVVNSTNAVTTDTIYRGRVVASAATAKDIAATFHNSLTLLSSEILGRSFGGGVLELVPSEVSRLAMPNPVGAGKNLAYLDQAARREQTSIRETAEIVDLTNSAIVGMNMGLDKDLMMQLESARQTLVARRLDRN
jgi:adenine-specific DNA-methyltransferase